MFARAATQATARALSWSQLQPLAASYSPGDKVNGATNAQATLRLFGNPESQVRVTLFRE